MRVIGGALALAVGVGGCEMSADPFREEQERSATLAGTSTSSSLSGMAQVAWTEGTRGFSVELAVEGDDAGQTRPWHVHFGSCAIGGGAIVGSERDYPPLSFDQGGRATMSTTITTAPLTVIELYYVDVHPSEARLDETLACGDLLDESEGGVPIDAGHERPR